MKRKKWSEIEEETLISQYSHLQKTGTLKKLKTREKKYKPIAEHVNSLHHLTDPISFPFKWSWRDVSIKVQNMRHQYVNVKHKIRNDDGEFIWEDGVHHWENFALYKDVFGDVEIEEKCGNKSGGLLGDEFFEVGFEELDESEESEGAREGKGALVGAQVMELRDVVMRREEKKREREFRAEGEIWDEGEEVREMVRARQESERMMKMEMEFDEERKRRRKVEEKWEEEEMKWREKMVSMQIEHEKQMMQLHANACQNQMQILGVMARFFCQFFGSANDGLGSLVAPQVLQHTIPGGLDDNGKPDANSPSEFM